jgi:hypothetical protein
MLSRHAPCGLALPIADSNDTFLRMNHRRKKISLKEQLKGAIDDLLEGSGFEIEAPDAAFSGAVRLDATFVSLSPNTSQ